MPFERSRRLPLSLVLLLLAGCAGAPRGAAVTDAAAARGAAEPPRTRAERTDYRETSHHADVLAFLDALAAAGARMHRGVLGTSAEGREIPYVVASRPQVRTPDGARALGRPIVFVQGNIHGGEVEGKEALQMLLRELLLESRPNVLDSLVLIAVPIYNADGNERWGPQARHRSEQHGPEQVGQRANGQGLDLNRDYVKAVSPETRGALAMFGAWDPDVFVDLHTTNGSYHGYALTYAPSLNPAAGEAGRYARDELLPELRRRMRERHGFETFDYGNFSTTYGADVGPGARRDGWFTYDHRPRFGTNYYGLRGRVAILSEAYSHDPFERRVASTLAFVREILSLSAERAAGLRALRDAPPPGPGDPVPLRSVLTRTPHVAEVIAEELAADPDSVPHEPGVRRGVRRTGRFVTLRLPVHDRFDPVLVRTLPAAYAVAAPEPELVRLLEQHGIAFERLAQARPARVEAFAVDTVIRAERPFQAHHELRLEGRWHLAQRTLPAGALVVPTAQRLGRLAAYLLEPESDDGIAVWSSPAEPRLGRAFLASEPRAGAEFPVLRVSAWP